jgi:hypothetical protein
VTPDTPRPPVDLPAARAVAARLLADTGIGAYNHGDLAPLASLVLALTAPPVPGGPPPDSAASPAPGTVPWALEFVGWWDDTVADDSRSAVVDAAVVLRKYALDCRALACVDPWDRGFLRALGFARHMQPAGSNDLSWRSPAKLAVSVFFGDPRDEPGAAPRWAVDGEWVPAALAPRTRGDVVRLLALAGDFTRPAG